ncbi:MAG: transcription termination/antitermination protein NusG [Armatimonadetes bacterium]|nr:transcription termination/antitermination protein NusG [Armatimonadota bacterium]
MERHWYAVHTYSGHENKVKTNIERRAASLGLQDKISRIVVPTEEELRVRAGKRTSVRRKIFPGYVLIEMALDDATWYLVKNTTGVTGFVTSGSGNKPARLTVEEVNNILQTVERSVQQPKVRWSKGDAVRVLMGPFADLTGKIEDVNLDKEKLRVMIELFGRDTPVELEFNQVEKVE